MMLAVLALSATSCNANRGGRERKIVVAAYTTPREAFRHTILPGFRAFWKQKTGEDVIFQDSYQGSGAQARAIIEGFEADVAALSLDPDVAKLEKAKLVTRDWRTPPSQGIVSRSIVVLAVREGNPKNIRDWGDLAKPGIEVVTPNVRTSGGAMWNIAAIYGAALRAPGGDAATAQRLVADILGNVAVMDKGARESIVTFEKGVGDVAITYENEVFVAKREGRKMDYVVPRSTILIENPVAVVDANARKHGVEDVAAGFVAYLATPEAQRAYADNGLRTALASTAGDATAAQHSPGFPDVEDLFTVRDLGGWGRLQADVFAKGAAYDRATASNGKSRR